MGYAGATVHISGAASQAAIALWSTVLARRRRGDRVKYMIENKIRLDAAMTMH